MSTLLKVYNNGLLDIFTEEESTSDCVNVAHIKLMQTCASSAGIEDLFIPGSMISELEQYVEAVPYIKRTVIAFQLDRKTVSMLSTR